MLKKLLKYELIATGRTFGVLYLIVVISAVLLGAYMGISMEEEVEFWGTVLTIFYIAAIFALIAITVVSIVQRFRRNLLGAEGYLMNTLPVTSEQLIFSKLIAAAIWAASSVVVGGLSFIIMMMGFAFGSVSDPVPLMKSIFNTEEWQALNNSFRLANGLTIGQYCAFAFSMLLGTGICVTLCAYASCMVGHQFPSHPVMISIFTFFVLNILQNRCENLFYGMKIFMENRKGSLWWNVSLFKFDLTEYGTIWRALAVFAVIHFAFAAVYFALTNYLLKNKLNLE